MPFTHLASMMNIFQSGIASLERVLDLLDTEKQSPDPVGSEPLPAVEGRVVFDHVTFSYSPERPLLEDLSLTAEPGQTVALVGPTGAGKTTPWTLLLRFYELNSTDEPRGGKEVV